MRTLKAKTLDGIWGAVRYAGKAAAAAIVFAALSSAGAQARNGKFILVDADTGVVLASRGANTPHQPASLAKMMTLYLAFDAVRGGRIGLKTTLPISAHAARQRPSKIYLSPGGSISVENLIRAITVKSANDAAVVVAEGISGTERRFAALMTETARRLGMKNSRFMNASGLDAPGQQTTAQDMAILTAALRQRFSAHFHYLRDAEMRYRGRYYRTANRMLAWNGTVRGMKIGFTRTSGYSYAALSKYNNRRIISVYLGANSADQRFAHARSLMRTGVMLAMADQTALSSRNGRLRIATITTVATTAHDSLAAGTVTRVASLEE